MLPGGTQHATTSSTPLNPQQISIHRRVVLAYLLLFLIRADFLIARPPAAGADSGTIRAIVDALRAKLQMTQEVEVKVVPLNERMVSVERIAGASGGWSFVISFDARFLASLEPDELNA